MDKQKECFKCKEVKLLEQFYKHPDMPDGRVNKCKECNKLDNKENWHLKREEKREYDKYRHRYSIPRIFNQRYSGIKERCENGRSNGLKYSVTGKEYLSKEEWLKWCYEEKNYKEFIKIYKIWVDNSFIEKLSPSIDRINNNLSYITTNLQWLSKSDNCKKYNK